MSLQDKIKNAKETSWPLVTPKKETITYLDGFADGLNMANNFTNKMLDKIRAEIESIEHYGTNDGNDFWLRTPDEIKKDVITIIDKYKGESEPQESEDKE